MFYIKHLIQCKCILKLYEDRFPPVFHKFIVFTELDKTTGDVIPSFAHCNNCGVIHKVIEIGQSVVVPKEDMRSLPTIEEIEFELPPKVSSLLKNNDCDLHVWQEAKYILENKLWGKFVVISKEVSPTDKSLTLGKALVIHGESLFKIESFEQTDEVVL